MPTNKQRRDAARRHLERQLQRRQAQEAKQRRRMLVATVAGTLVLAAIIAVVVVTVTSGSGKHSAAQSSSSATSSGTPVPSSTPVAQTNGPCHYVKAEGQQAQGLKNVGLPPDPKPTPTKNINVTFTTNRGVIQATLDGKSAPCNVQSIAYLIQKKFYDNTPCPRVVNSGIYVVQCGSGGDTTSGGPDYTVHDENLTKASYTAGTIAMANSGPDTNGSQFFFITKDSNSGLQKDYTVVGHVTKGLDILQKVAAGGDDGSAGQAGGGKPKLALDFKTVRITSVQGGGPTPGAGPSPTIVVAPSATPTPTPAG